MPRQTDTSLYPLHVKVPGRARFKVSGLAQRPHVKGLLEPRLNRLKGIRSVSASALTGNLLVLFDPRLKHQAVAALIHRVLRTLQGERRDGGALSPTQRSGDPVSRQPALRRLAARSKDALVRMAFPPPPAIPDLRTWHLMDGPSALALLETSGERGLPRKTAEKRLRDWGPNTLPESKSRSEMELLLRQFMSLPVALLGAAAGLSILTGGLLEALLILGVVTANALIGYATESKAERTISSLKRFVRPSAQVMREGRLRHIPAEEVVLGDLLVLKPGSYVSADCRVVMASHLSVDESVLTGESMPVLKTTRTLRRQDLPIADRRNMAYMGTLVTGGEALALVVATGASTEIGRLQLLLEETTSPQTPIERQLRETGDQLVVLGGSICGLVFFIGLLRGYGFLPMIRTAVSLAAAAIPEGLPAAATINFALGIGKMKAHHVLIRRLQAVETLGAIQTVCLDKTGTITENRMTVTDVHTGLRLIEVRDGRFFAQTGPMDPLASEELRQLVYACTLCNEAKINGNGGDGRYLLSGTPTESALLRLAILSGVDVPRLRRQYKLLKISYRAENRLFMSTLHASPEPPGRFFALKGSPPEVLARCDAFLADGRRSPLTAEVRRLIEKENERMAGEALRVLGLACARPQGEPGAELEKGLTWLGLVGMEDPIRTGVRALIDVYHRAGIHTVMITGDQSPTAYAVARELGLSGEEPLEMLDSLALARLEPDLLEALARKTHVYSRVSPAHKLQIVRALQKGGMVVAMTGDGINDGPALKAADMGIAMGLSGTDVAREVADVVIEDDNLASLITAVQDGRTTYENIRKSVHFFLSTNLTEIMVIFASLAAGIGVPLNVMQLLWINVLSDILPGLALSLEASDEDVLEQPPREAHRPLFAAKDFRRMAREAAVISLGALGAYAYGFARYGMGARAGSLAFHGLTAGQLLHALSCRSEDRSILGQSHRPPNRLLDLALGGSFLLQGLTVAVPSLRRLLGVTPLGLADMAVIAGSALLPLALNEMAKGKKAG